MARNLTAWVFQIRFMNFADIETDHIVNGLINIPIFLSAIRALYILEQTVDNGFHKLPIQSPHRIVAFTEVPY